MPTRRKALGAVAQAATGLALLPFAPRRAESSVLVNDIHSQLNPTRVDRTDLDWLLQRLHHTGDLSESVLLSNTALGSSWVSVHAALAATR